MITNQLNKTKLSESRTVDSDTGIYLKWSGGSGREHIEIFMMIDGDTTITVNTEFNDKVFKELGKHEVRREVRNVSFSGRPRRADYLDILERLLAVHGFQFRISELRDNYSQEVEVTVAHRVVQQFSEWSGDNV